MASEAFTVQLAVELPAGVVGFGLAEIAYLVSRDAGAAAAKSRDIMVLEGLSDDSNFLRAGASSLVARGLLSRTERGEVVTRSWARVLEYALVSASVWTELWIQRRGTSDLALVLSTPAVVAILQPRVLGTWFAAFTDQTTDTAVVVMNLMDGVGSEDQTASFSVHLSSTSTSIDVGAMRGDPASGQWEVDGRRCSRVEAEQALRVAVGRV